MIYVQNHKLIAGRQVGKWHKIDVERQYKPVAVDMFTDCGRHRVKEADKVTTRKARNLTLVNSCGVCFGPKDWIR